MDRHSEETAKESWEQRSIKKKEKEMDRERAWSSQT